MSGFFQLASAVFTRIIFFVHGFISVYFVVQSEKNAKYWWLCTGLVFLVLESFYTIIIRKGQEYKYFWPGSFLYMCTVLPAIWVAELSILAEKEKQDPKECILAEQKNIHYSSIYGVINIRTDSSTQAQKFSKLGLILVIIIGRWLLPRGSLTRDQLSALLLVYVANAADIMELFELFDVNPSLWCRDGVAKAVLATYTWCFMQFTLVFTATTRTVPDEAKKKMSEAMFKTQENTEMRPGTKYKGREKKLPRYIRKMIKQKQLERLTKFEDELNQVYGSPVEAPKPKKQKQKGRKYGIYSMHETVNDVVTVQRKIKIEEEIIEEVIKEKEKLRLHGDLYSILTLMLMQDGPFLCVRLVMTLSYDVDDETHLFFTGKNAIALSVLIYRLIVLLYEGKDENVDDEDVEFTQRPKPFAISFDRETANSRQSGRRKMVTSPV
ncbi:transmembrane protein 26-like [Actinia tenebrosa]|uniref:Transmembrane protein 26-like n=1 Tax=Actinia tenebrosa TaxID=6105 RepID=A0A6P8HC75_ACTTE|nr:transmembrane protein 26-like [Actinia tenebrosa]